MGSLDIEELVLRIRVMAEQAEIGIDAVRAGLESLDSSNQKSADTAKQAGKQAEQAYKQQGQSADAAAAQQMAAFAAVAAAATQAFRIIVGAIQTGIDANNQYLASIQGLQSVAFGRGIGADQMEAALASLTDRFFDTTAAATSLKNLLSRNYSLEQAVQTITRLKDAAAFGRQASYGLAQAVVSATEGIKNENSVLVDNAGVTKNVAKMWEEYAKQIGVSVQSLTLAQKIDAEYQGIMQETRFQVGDLAKLTNTLAGSQAEAAMSGELLTRAFGESMSPAVGIVTEVWNGFLVVVRGVVETFPGLTAGATSAVIAIAGLVAANKAVLALKALDASMKTAAGSATFLGVSLKTAMPWLLAIGAVVAIYSSVTRAMEASAKAAEEAAQAQREEFQEKKNVVSDLKALEDRYEALTKKKRLSYNDTRELRSIEQQLADKYGISVDVLGSLAGAYDTVTDAIRNKRIETAKEMQSTLDSNLDSSKQAMVAAQANMNNSKIAVNLDYLKDLQKAYTDVSASAKGAHFGINEVFAVANQKWDLSESTAAWSDFVSTLSRDDQARIFSGPEAFISILAEKIKDGQEIVDSVMNATTNTIRAAMDSIENELTGLKLSDVFTANMRDLVEGLDFSGGIDVDQFMQRYADLLTNADVAPALAAMQEMNEKITSGATITEDDKRRYLESYDQLLGSGLLEFIQGYSSQAEAIWRDLTNGLLDGANDLDAFWAGIAQNSIDAIQSMSEVEKQTVMDNLREQAEAVATDYQKSAEKINETKDALEALAKMQEAQAKGVSFDSGEVQGYAETVKEKSDIVIGSYQAMGQAQEALNTDLRANTADYNAIGVQYNTVVQSIKKWITAMEEAKAAAEEGSEAYTLAEGSLSSLEQMFSIMRRAASGSLHLINFGQSSKKFDLLTASYSELKKQLASTAESMSNLQKRMDISKETVKQVTGWKQIITSYKNGKASIEQYQEALKQMGLASDTSVADAMKHVDKLGSSLASNIDTIEDQINDLILEAQALQNAAKINGYVDLDISQFSLAAATAKEDLAAILDVLKQAGFNARGGGGGGSSRYQKDIDAMEHLKGLEQITYEQELAHLLELEAKYKNKRGRSTLSLSDQRDLEQRIFDLNEDIRQKDLDAAYNALDHRKALNHLTLQEEMAMLEAIKVAHALNAEELEDMAEKLYAVQEAIRQEQYQSAMDTYSHQKAMGRLTLAQEIDVLEQIKLAHQLNAAELASIEEQLYSLREQLRQEAYQADMALLDHRKAMGQVTAEQEIAALEQILAAHQLTQDELWQMEERLYALREQLRQENLTAEEKAVQEQQKQLNTLAQGVITAIKNRYQAMQDEELASLDASREAWKKWSDDNVAAIQAQIDALDDLAQTEDREAKDAAELRKIANLQLAIQYEQDNYNRAQLQKQLDQALADRTSRLAKQDRDDQKAALQDEIKAIQDKAKEEQATLDEQKDAVRDAYKERMEAAAIQAEAERLLMTESQENLLALIGEFAPDYNATGKSLGEQWLDGFLTSIGNGIENWFAAFNDRIAEIQDGIAQTALAASDAFYAGRVKQQERATAGMAEAIRTVSTNIQQTLIFNQPIESPADVSRRMQRENEALAASLV